MSSIITARASYHSTSIPKGGANKLECEHKLFKGADSMKSFLLKIKHKLCKLLIKEDTAGLIRPIKAGHEIFILF
jgi:hypothetical protein